MKAKAKIKGKSIIIEIPLSQLDSEESIPNELLDDAFSPIVRVVDRMLFAEELLYELNREEEDGSTPITHLLDACFVAADNNGARGIETIPQEN